MLKATAQHHHPMKGTSMTKSRDKGPRYDTADREQFHDVHWPDPSTETVVYSSPIIKYFACDHLPKHVHGVSRAVQQLALAMEQTLPDGPEKSAGLRKLLEAKDCFVRAALEKS